MAAGRYALGNPRLWITAVWVGMFCGLLTPAFCQQLELGNPKAKQAVPAPAALRAWQCGQSGGSGRWPGREK